MLDVKVPYNENARAQAALMQQGVEVGGSFSSFLFPFTTDVLNPSGHNKTENQKGDNASLPPAQGLAKPEPQSTLQACEHRKNLRTESALRNQTQEKARVK